MGFLRSLVHQAGASRRAASFTLSLLIVGLVAFSANSYAQDDEEQSAEQANNADSSLSREVEDLKKSAIELNRDLLILEEELLFPSNTQLALFLSVDVGHFFRLDSVKISVDDELVASHLYTERQNSALIRGGIQRLYVGNVKSGKHEITAIFTGIGPENREYKRGATMIFDKDEDPKMIEVRVRDSEALMQPKFDFKEWEL